MQNFPNIWMNYVLHQKFSACSTVGRKNAIIQKIDIS
jgi:hypothetical protein